MLIDNSTCGLDLSKNWTSSSVMLTCIERTAKALAFNKEALWFDEKQNLIYCFGGDMSCANNYHGPVPHESIWAFTPDGKGSGNWKEVLGPTGAKPFPPDILRRSSGAIASDESHGYYLGGWVARTTSLLSTKIEKEFVPGLLTLNFTDLTITKTSDGFYEYSQMVNVPHYGTSGVFVILGSGTWPSSVPFNNVTIYDKTKQKLYSQLASGAIPDIRVSYCIVGIRGIESDTFEM